MTIKGFIVNIGHGLKRNKLTSQIILCCTTNVYSPQQTNVHMSIIIETIYNREKIYKS
jgi:hypothetical protein